ncbi:MAG: diguanylate cyclase, partial [Rhodomicrobium sp.]|nr:diguanylate cyclase [Rhodomicrobium sp.]
MTISSVAGRWLEGLSRAATGLPAFRRALPLTALAFAVEIVIMVGLRQAFGDIGSQLAILLDATILAVGVFFLSSLIDLYSPSLLALINRQQRLLFCAFLFLTQILTHILIEPLESHLPPGATELLDAALTGAIACIGLSWVLWIDDINAAVGAKTENPANLLSQTSLAMHSMLGVIALIFTLLLTGDFASWLQSTGTARVMNIAGNQRSLGQRLAHLDSMITEEPLRRAQFQPLLESLLDQIELEGRQLKSLIHANSHVWENKTKAMLSRLGELDQARKALIDAVKAELRNGPQSERSLNIHRLSETMLVHSEALVLTLQTFFDEQDHKARTEIFLKAFASYGILVLISLALVSRIVRFISLQAKRQTEVQEKLEASLARFGSYKQAIDQQFIFARTDRAGRIVDVNDRFCAISGYGREELIGRNHRILNSGEHSSGFFKDMWQTIASGRTWTGEICNRAKDGSLYWVRSVVFPLFDAKGRIEQFAAIRTDITDTKKAQKLLHDAVESVPDGFVIYDAGDRLVICNEAYRELYSLAAPAIKEGATFKDILAHGLRCGQFPTVGQTEDERTRWLEERLAEHRQANSDCLQALPDGRWVQIRERKTASGYTVGFRTDVSKLVRQAAVLDTIMQNFPGGIALIDPEFRVVATNEAYRELLELPDTLFENGPPTLETLFRFNAKRGEYGPGEIEDLVQLRLERLQLGLPHLYERQRPDGRVLEVRGAPITGGGYVAAYIDISERREAQQNLWRLANLDSLTGLANRMLFNERLASIIKLAERNKQPFALAVIDLDKFKEINDCHGHDQGDVLLKAVAERLQSAVRDSDTVARLGGDEFALILNKAISQADLRRPLEAIQSAMEVPVEIGGARRICSLSIGVTSYPADGATPTELLKNADIALYRAKAMGRGRVEYYSAEMRRGYRARGSGPPGHRYCAHRTPVRG